MKIPPWAGAGAALALAGGQTTTSFADKMSISIAPFGLKDGKSVELFALRNARGMEVDITNYGAVITAIRVPDRDGRIEDVALGYDDLAGYEKGTSYFGAIVGRYGNRIARGEFALDGRTCHLPINDPPNSLHGGKVGFNQQVWTAEAIEGDGSVGVRLTYVSPDGDQGYPGALTVVVSYTLDDRNELGVGYAISSDAPTVANVTNHTYFNLKGEGRGTILDHEIRIDADRYTPTDATLIPTGELAPVRGTPMDFRRAAVIGGRIDEKFPPLVTAGGYDHNYVLDGTGFRRIAEVSEPASGRVLEVFTDQPGVQFYSGNFLRDEPGRAGHTYVRRGGFCLETQHFPDSPNQPGFPSTVIEPGKTFTSRTAYRFSTR